MPSQAGAEPGAAESSAGEGLAIGGGGADDAETAPDEEELEMMAAMGFPTGFDSTQGKGVGDPRCKVEGLRRKEVRKYRQYMNRRGGFNRPLDEM